MLWNTVVWFNYLCAHLFHNTCIQSLGYDNDDNMLYHVSIVAAQSGYILSMLRVHVHVPEALPNTDFATKENF